MTEKIYTGFTLIELLTAVLIIGILAAVALPQYQLAVEKSRATQALIAVKAAATAQRIYFLETGAYAVKWEDLDIDMPAYKIVNNGGDYAYLDNGWEISLKTANLILGIRSVTGRPMIAFDLTTGLMSCCTNIGTPEIQKWKSVCISLGAKDDAPALYERKCYKM
jgi:prepilin-type N-terminal cleavage/methylation domain-containing protein